MKKLTKITDFDGVSITRMCELAQAEKEGRIIIDPPNTPLTLEELREMDGEPVWVERKERKERIRQDLAGLPPQAGGGNAMKISCSLCGADYEFHYSAGNVLNAVYNLGWGSYGAALYCPDCTATWDERNKGRTHPWPENTIGLIDEWYRHSKMRPSL